jgi:hypothetical protein
MTLEDEQKLKQIEELMLYGVHDAVVRGFVSDMEQSFVAEALARVQRHDHEGAIVKYFFAMLLPGCAARRDELMRHALFSLDHIAKNGFGIDQIKLLDHPLFENLKRELNERRIQKKNNSIAEQFRRLDAEPVLLNKDFHLLGELINQLSQSDSSSTEWLLAKARLSQEKEAQDQFRTIIDKMQRLTGDSEQSNRREVIYGEIRELTARAVEHAGWGNPAYGRQITDYVSSMEEHLTRSDTEKIVAKMDLELNEYREKHREEFIKAFNSGGDERTILETICKKLKIFRNDTLLEDIKRVSINWVARDCKLRLEAAAVDDPARARLLVGDSLRIIEEYKETLPDEIRVGFREFLESLDSHPGPEQESEVEVVEMAPPEPDENRILKWLKRLFGARGIK